VPGSRSSGTVARNVADERDPSRIGPIGVLPVRTSKGPSSVISTLTARAVVTASVAGPERTWASFWT